MNRLYGSQNLYHVPLQAITSTVVVKMGLQNICSSSTGNAVVKTGLLNLYRLSTGNAVVRAGMTMLYRLSTSFAVAKTGLENIYRSSTGFAVVKTGLPEHLQAFNTTFCGSQNLFVQSLQGFNRLTGRQTSLPNFYRPLRSIAEVKIFFFFEPLQALNWLCSCEVNLLNIYKTLTT